MQKNTDFDSWRNIHHSGAFLSEADKKHIDEYNRLLLKECELELDLRDIEDAVLGKYPEAQTALAIQDDACAIDSSMPLIRRLLLMKMNESADNLIDTIELEISNSQCSVKMELMKVKISLRETKGKIACQERSRKEAEKESAKRRCAMQIV